MFERVFFSISLGKIFVSPLFELEEEFFSFFGLPGSIFGLLPSIFIFLFLFLARDMFMAGDDE